MTSKILVYPGILSPLAYIAAAVIGGILALNYSHLKDSVSELLMKGAANRSILITIMLISSVSMIIGCSGVLSVLSSAPKAATIGIIFLLSTGFIGIFTAAVFSQDPIGSSTTFSGIMHLVLVGIMALLSMSAIVLVGFGMKSVPGWTNFWIFSLVCVIIAFTAGALSPVIAAKKIPLLGLFERANILTYYTWLIVFFVKVIKTPV